MMSDLDPAIAEIVGIALEELGAKFTIIRTKEDKNGLCAALRGDDGKECSVCIDWDRKVGQVKAIDLFEERIGRLMKYRFQQISSPDLN